MASWTPSLLFITDIMVWTGSHFSFFLTDHIVWNGSELSPTVSIGPHLSFISQETTYYGVNRFRTQPHGVNRSTYQLLSQQTTYYGVNRFTSQPRPHGVNRFRTQPHGVNRSTSQLLSQETTHNGVHRFTSQLRHQSVNRFTSQLRHQSVNRFTSQLTSRCEPVQIPSSLCKISRRKAVHILTTVRTGSHLTFCLRDHTLRCEPVQIPASLCETSRCEPVHIPAYITMWTGSQPSLHHDVNRFTSQLTSRCEPVHISDSDPSTSHTGHVNDRGQRRYGRIAENW